MVQMRVADTDATRIHGQFILLTTAVGALMILAGLDRILPA
jgi:hypothetical protein